MVKVTTEEGEQIHYHQEELSVGTQLDGETDTALLLWPLIISHKYWRAIQWLLIKHLPSSRIDEDSPLWQIGPQDLPKARFEIILILEGIIEATGNTTQARTSYLSDEILWGQRSVISLNLFLNNKTFSRFKNIMSYVENQGVYAVNCASLDEVRAEDVSPFLAKSNLSRLSRQKRRGTRPPGHRPLRSRTWKLEGDEPLLPMGPSPWIHQMSGCERWGNDEIKKYNLIPQVCKPSGAWDWDAWWAWRPVQPGCYGEFGPKTFF